MKLIFNLQNQQKIDSSQLFILRVTTRVNDTRIDRDWVILVTLKNSKHSKTNYLSYLSTTYQI